jgi:hypothetical protein
MRAERSQTGMKIEIVNMFTWDLLQSIPLARQFSFLDGLTKWLNMPTKHVLLQCQGYSRDHAVWNVFVFTFIPVWIHAGLKSVGSVQQAEWLETGLSYFRPDLM